MEAEPTLTSPKASEDGATTKFEALATVVADKATSIGESGALLLIIIVPAALPVAVAVKVVATLPAWPAARTSGKAGAITAKPVPATEMPETERDLVPELRMVKVFVALWPTVSEPKLMVDGLTSIEALPAPEVPGLPATPTQPEVNKMEATINRVARISRINGKGKRRERKRASTSAPSRMGVSVITNSV